MLGELTALRDCSMHLRELVKWSSESFSAHEQPWPQNNWQWLRYGYLLPIKYVSLNNNTKALYTKPEDYSSLLPPLVLTATLASGQIFVIGDDSVHTEIKVHATAFCQAAQWCYFWPLLDKSQDQIVQLPEDHSHRQLFKARQDE